jgi:hypothetical protein
VRRRTEAPKQPCDDLNLEEVARRLDRANVTWAVFAGAAAAIYGAQRPLTDVDILVSAAEVEQAASLFPEGQIKRRANGEIDQIYLPGFDIVPGFDAIDLDEQMAQHLTRHRLCGVTVPVIPAEDNILLKAKWRRGPETGKHDWEDVEAMLANVDDLDWQYLRWRANAWLTRRQAAQLLAHLRLAWGRCHV